MTTQTDPAPEQRSLRTVRAVAIFDPARVTDTSPEKQFNELLLVYEQDHYLKLDARRADVFDPTEADRTELIVFDWGGMALGNNLLGHQLRALIRRAEDHPSALVIIRSIAVLAVPAERDRRRAGAGAPQRPLRRRAHADPLLVARHRDRRTDTGPVKTRNARNTDQPARQRKAQTRA